MPLMERLLEQWKETPPAHVALAQVVAWLSAFAGGGGKRSRSAASSSAKDTAAKSSNLVADWLGAGGVGFAKGKGSVPLPADPGGVMKQFAPNG